MVVHQFALLEQRLRAASRPAGTQPLLQESKLMDDHANTKGGGFSLEASSPVSSRWAAPRRKKASKAYQAAVIAKQKYDRTGTVLREFSEPQIERRYQDWYDHEYKHGVLATF